MLNFLKKWGIRKQGASAAIKKFTCEHPSDLRARYALKKEVTVRLPSDPTLLVICTQCGDMKLYTV